MQPRDNHSALTETKSTSAIHAQLGYRLKKIFTPHSSTYKKIKKDLLKVSKSCFIDLSHQKLGKALYKFELYPLFSAIPSNVTDINLRNNYLGYCTASHKLLKCMKALPPNLYRLDVSKNHLFQQGSEWLVHFLSSLPKNLYSLDIRDNGLQFFSEKELVDIFAAMPRNINWLYWDNNFFLQPKLTSMKLISIFKVIPPIVNLSFRGSAFEMKGFADVVKNIPKTVQFLDFKDSDFGKLSGDAFRKILNGIIAPIVDLKFENIWGSTFPIELDKIFSAIPSTVKYLILWGNDFALLTVAEVIRAFQAIPFHVTKLRFKNNFWPRFTNIDLINVFRSIPYTITSLQFEIDEFQLMDNIDEIENILTIYQALPATVANLIAAGINTSFPLYAIFQILPPTISSLHLIDYDYSQNLKEIESMKTFSYLPKTVNSLGFMKLHSAKQMTDTDIVALVNSFPYQVSQIMSEYNQSTIEALLHEARRRTFDCILQHTNLHKDEAGLVLSYAGNKENFWQSRWYEKSEEESSVALNKFLLR